MLIAIALLVLSAVGLCSGDCAGSCRIENGSSFSCAAGCKVCYLEQNCSEDIVQELGLSGEESCAGPPTQPQGSESVPGTSKSVDGA